MVIKKISTNYAGAKCQNSIKHIDSAIDYITDLAGDHTDALKDLFHAKNEIIDLKKHIKKRR